MAQFSRRDADALRRWHDEFVPIVRGILGPEHRSPPLPPGERRALLERTAAGRRLLDVSAFRVAREVLGYPAQDFGPAAHRAQADVMASIAKCRWHLSRLVP